MIAKELVEFIREARKRGFPDEEIKKPLIKHGWPIAFVEEAFDFLENKNNEEKARGQIILYLDEELIEKLEKRAKKNLMKLDDQIEDILRRSTLSLKKSSKTEKLDDNLVGIFSRKRTGRKSKTKVLRTLHKKKR